MMVFGRFLESNSSKDLYFENKRNYGVFCATLLQLLFFFFSKNVYFQYFVNMYLKNSLRFNFLEFKNLRTILIRLTLII